MAGYALMDATVKYDLARFGLPGSSVGVNVNNLFDREYVSSCYSEYACYWGAGLRLSRPQPSASNYSRARFAAPNIRLLLCRNRLRTLRPPLR